MQDRTLTLNNVALVRFGSGILPLCADDLAERGATSVFLVTTPPTLSLCNPLVDALNERGIAVTLWSELVGEPTISEFGAALLAARGCAADTVVGLGGGSAMDVAKLVAALFDGKQQILDVVGVDKLAGRSLPLVCIPTTAGTGSEVTPIAILGDEDDDLKKGVVSAHLVPDAAYLDAALTVTVPPAVTAATGLDALTHCIEAYANRFSHPLADVYALAGIKLIAAHLERAVVNGSDLEARAAMLRASHYGGLCLGPVNTAAVHALAYPLGGEFHIAHGVANTLLLPHVLRFNLEAAPDRYADIAHALGVTPSGDSMRDGVAGIDAIIALSARCGVELSMSRHGIPADAIPRMAKAAMTVTRLLERNPRELTEQDCVRIYEAAL